MNEDQYGIMDKLEQTNWWYLGRRKIVKKMFAKYMSTCKDVLDVGCGTGEGRNIVPKEVVLSGLDESPIALEYAKEKGYNFLKQSSGDAIQFTDNSFEGIIMLDVLEHIEDDSKTLSECLRVLRPNGKLILTVPAYQWLWSGHDEVFGHKRRYTKKELVKKIKELEFEVIFSSYYFFTPLPAVVVFRVLERILVNRKKSHFFKIPVFINKILLFIISIESFLFEKGIVLPFGSSIIVVARKL